MGICKSVLMRKMKDKAEDETALLEQQIDYGSRSGINTPEHEEQTGASNIRQGINTPEHEEQKGSSNIRQGLGRYFKQYFPHLLYSPLKVKKIKRKCYFSWHFLSFLCMAIQIAKTVCITLLILEFGDQRRYFQDVIERGYTTIEHLLLENWSSEMETPPYPPSRGPYALYTRQHLTEHINYVVENYYNFESKAIGVYLGLSTNKTDLVRICVKYFEFDIVPADNGTSVQPPRIHDPCFDAKLNSNGSYDIEEDIKRNNISDEAAFKRFLSINVSFELYALRISEDLQRGQCVNIDGTISFTDDINAGQAVVKLNTVTSRIKCRTIGVDLIDVCLFDDVMCMTKAVLWLSCVSLLECGCSFLLCCLFCLIKRTKDCIIGIIKIKWSLALQLVGDVMIIWQTKSTLEHQHCELNSQQMEEKDQRSRDLDIHAIYLGIGCLLCWMTLTRYLNFHQNVGILFKTMKSSFPSVGCYLFGATVLFTGFALCGYVVFGPYHNKFQKVNYTASTLVSIINGDEIFATWANFDVDKAGYEPIMHVYAVYLCLYVLIFAGVVFNILIAIFNSAYAVIQKTYDEEHQEPLLRKILQFLTEVNVSETPQQLQESLKKFLLEIKPYIQQEVLNGTGASEKSSLISVLGDDNQLFKTYRQSLCCCECSLICLCKE